jgi:hypothetical protein
VILNVTLDPSNSSEMSSSLRYGPVAGGLPTYGIGGFLSIYVRKRLLVGALRFPFKNILNANEYLVIFDLFFNTLW